MMSTVHLCIRHRFFGSHFQSQWIRDGTSEVELSKVHVFLHSDLSLTFTLNPTLDQPADVALRLL